MSVPASGEQHERAVEAMARALYTDEAGGPDSEWYKHGVPWEQVDHGHWLAQAALILDAYHHSLAEQGVRLVDLAEVVTWLRQAAGIAVADGGDDAAVRFHGFADGLERRFGGHEGNEARSRG